MVVAIAAITMGCSGIEPVSDPAGGATYIELNVEPANTRIYIDDEYMGTVDGWHHQMVPIEPGHRRLKLDADGYIPQRLDVDIDEGRTVTVHARLEPDIATPDGEHLDDRDSGGDEVDPTRRQP